MRPISKQPPADQERDAELVASLEWLARAAVSAGFDASAFLKASRRAFALAGQAELSAAKSAKKVSTSQVSAITGLTRKELPDLVSRVTPELPRLESPAWSVVRHWQNCPKYLEKKGRPKVLSIDSGEGSFKCLVRDLVPDVPHMSVLKELERLGFAERRNDKTVALDSRVDKKMGHRLSSFRDLSVKTKVFGGSAFRGGFMLSSGEVNDLKVLRQIPEKMVGLFLRNFSERATSLLAAVDKWHLANVHNSAEPGPLETVGLGVYLFREAEPDAAFVESKPPRKAKRRAKRA